mgnify:FL=1
MNCKIRGSLSQSKNPSWPPTKGDVVLIEHPNHINDLFTGIVKEYINEGVVISLLNRHNYSDQNIVDKAIPNSLLLIRSYGWRYVNMQKLESHFGNCLIDDSFTGVPNPSVHVDNYEINKQEHLRQQPNILENNDLINTQGEQHYEMLTEEEKIIKDGFEIAATGKQNITSHSQEILNIISDNTTIEGNDMKIVVSYSLSIKNLITSKLDEQGEGEKIVNWIKAQTTNNVYSFMKDFTTAIFDGYVHIRMPTIDVNDKITDIIIPTLHRSLNWQYGKSIDYDVLKHMLFQLPYQQSKKNDVVIRKDVEKILSQEYLVVLQPSPQYQLWVLRRILACWSSDKKLLDNIRKVKVIINQYRCRSDVNYNKQHGILPSIVIYPKYGSKSAQIVTATITKYFGMWSGTIAWGISKPSYFIRVNDLVWYTNGSIDLKLYYAKTVQSAQGTLKNDSFNDTFTKLNDVNDLIEINK